MRTLTAIAGGIGIVGISFLGAALFDWAVHSGPAVVSNPVAASDPAGKCGYYTTSRGQQVPRPCGNWHDGGERPAGATAKCEDGTWSWSKHPNYSGTCSYHGGVVG